MNDPNAQTARIVAKLTTLATQHGDQEAGKLAKELHDSTGAFQPTCGNCIHRPGFKDWCQKHQAFAKINDRRKCFEPDDYHQKLTPLLTD